MGRLPGGFTLTDVFPHRPHILFSGDSQVQMFTLPPPGIISSLFPIIAGIYGALTMREALHIHHLQPHNMQSNHDCSPSQLRGLGLREANQPSSVHRVSQGQVDLNPSTEACSLLTSHVAPTFSALLRCCCLRSCACGVEWGWGASGGGRSHCRNPGAFTLHT